MIGSEENLWRIFGGKDCLEPGPWSQYFEHVQRCLLNTWKFHPRRVQAAPLKKVPEIALSDKTRFYLLIGRDRQAWVPQALLLVIGKAMRDPELKVQYLGTAAPD